MSNILISGGSRGIGKGIVELFASNGYNVTYLYKNNPGPTGDNIFPIQCDVKDPESCKNAVAMAHEKFGDIDVLISNSGISLTGLATDFVFDDYHNVMDTNFGGLFNLANLIIPEMVSRKNGSIIAISSMWGQVGASCEALYSASKGAVDAYVKSLAKELGPSGIRVNAVSPGCIDTDMMKEYSDEDKQALIEETPIQRLGNPEDVANAVLYLASDKSAFITGQIIAVNGGFII